MKHETVINNKIPANLRAALDAWIAGKNDKVQNALAGGLVLYLTVDNVLRSAALGVVDQLATKKMTLDDLLDAIEIAREREHQRQQRASQLAMPPPKEGGHRKIAG